MGVLDILAGYFLDNPTMFAPLIHGDHYHISIIADIMFNPSLSLFYTDCI